MDIPATWPTPGNPDTSLRVFRIEIECPGGVPVLLTAHIEEVISGEDPRYRSDLALQAQVTDPEILAYMQTVQDALKAATYLLYQRLLVPEPAPDPETP